MVWLFAGLVGCTGDEGLKALKPDIVVTPEVLDFGQVVEDYTLTAELQIINSGLGKLHLSAIEIANDDAGVFSIGDVPSELGNDASFSLAVTFAPRDPLPYTATLVLTSDDETNPVESVTLTGTGVVAPTPNIDCDTLSLDYAVVAPGGVGTEWVTCTNIGDDDLVISGLAQAGSGAFQTVGDPTGYTVPPGQDLQIIVLYLPTTEAGDNGSLTLTSNDPDAPEVRITLVGNGGGDFEYPIAVITGPDTSEPRESVVLAGGDSYDPSGFEPLTYAWAVVGPYEDVPAEANSSNLFVQLDLAGVYRVSLQVTNAIGLMSAPAIHTVTVVPTEDLHVELIWDTLPDLDLHLLRGGATLFTGDGDCNYCNVNPDWGAVGALNDPTLDLDAYSFPPGIENINIDTPASDTYSVKVHYFKTNGAGDVTATVNFYLYGVREASYSKVLGYDDVWDVGRIIWPDGFVLEETTELAAAPIRGCILE